jgi:deoxyribodipyrimidine photolyase-related protein
MKKANIIFPHQLFKDTARLNNKAVTFLIEENLFFKQYNFHKQKIAFHRASMKFYEEYLTQKALNVEYIDSAQKESDIRILIKNLHERAYVSITIIDPVDEWLLKRIKHSCEQFKIELNVLESQMFLNSNEDLKLFFNTNKKRYFQTEFYKQERIKRNILMDDANQPMGGQWTYDIENRKKYPKNKEVIKTIYPTENKYIIEAYQYVEENFKNNLGELSGIIQYPCTFIEAEQWLQEFFKNRMNEFGIYEDAILENEILINHSLLSAVLNVGLLTPDFIVAETLKYCEENNIPINSTEGFIRQIIGWREFIRGVYLAKGTEERTKNFWGFKRKIPKSFYDGTTGITPIDITIKKLLKTGYCHHIERLMVLGNFMLLCEFDPDEVYRWFMEFFIDAYDWVMVPNIYGMSQFADGGLMSTKPYVGGSNYLMKMSDYKKGDWQETWDALFWRFLDVHREVFLKNPRLGMLVKTYDKWPDEKKQALLDKADHFLATSYS